MCTMKVHSPFLTYSRKAIVISDFPVDAVAKSCLSIMNDEAMALLAENMLDKLLERLHTQGKIWSQKVTKLGNPFGKEKRTYAGKLYINPLPEMPRPLNDFSADASKYISQEFAATNLCQTEEEPSISHCLLAFAQLLRTMKTCCACIGESNLNLFRKKYDIAKSYCDKQSQLSTLLMSIPTGYLLKYIDEMTKDSKISEECRNQAVEFCDSIKSITCVQTFIDVLRDLFTRARNEVEPPEVKSKYRSIRRAFEQLKLDDISEGTP